jgi:hypothetical protein
MAIQRQPSGQGTMIKEQEPGGSLAQPFMAAGSRTSGYRRELYTNGQSPGLKAAPGKPLQYRNEIVQSAVSQGIVNLDFNIQNQ